MDIGQIYCLASKTAINFLMVFSLFAHSKSMSDLEILSNLHSHSSSKVKGYYPDL